MRSHVLQKTFLFGLGLLGLSMVSSCLRGQPSEKPPFHVFLDMDDQPKYQAFEKNEFFANQSSMRNPVPGTQAYGEKDWSAVNGNNPLKASRDVLEKGQERFNIYCSPCHGMVGDGKGIVAQRGAKLGYVAPTNLHDPLMKEKNDAHFYDIITHGIRNMGAYGGRTNAEERWAMVHYIRALQLSQETSSKNVPDKVISQQK